MVQKITDQLEQVKRELQARREEAADIGDLVKGSLDRDYHIDLWELSPRELDGSMGDRLSLLNDDIDTRPDPSAVASHRRLLGKPIVLVKKIFMKLTAFYTNALLEKQRQFNAQVVAFQLASFIRFRRIEEGLREIEERIAAVEDNLELRARDFQKEPPRGGRQ